MKRLRFPGIGMRTVKTGLAVLLCMLLYTLIKVIVIRLNPSPGSWFLNFYSQNEYRHYLYACVAAIVAMQGSIENSLRYGRMRILGTFLGGGMGILFLWIDDLLWNRTLTIPITVIGVVSVIYICTLFNLKDAPSNACVVLLIILLTFEEDNPYIYAANRIVDTAIGTAISVGVNTLIKNPERMKKYKSDNTTITDEQKNTNSPA